MGISCNPYFFKLPPHCYLYMSVEFRSAWEHSVHVIDITIIERKLQDREPRISRAALVHCGRASFEDQVLASSNSKKPTAIGDSFENEPLLLFRRRYKLVFDFRICAY